MSGTVGQTLGYSLDAFYCAISVNFMELMDIVLSYANLVVNL